MGEDSACSTTRGSLPHHTSDPTPNASRTVPKRCTMGGPLAKYNNSLHICLEEPGIPLTRSFHVLGRTHTKGQAHTGCHHAQCKNLLIYNCRGEGFCATAEEVHATRTKEDKMVWELLNVWQKRGHTGTYRRLKTTILSVWDVKMLIA